MPVGRLAEPFDRPLAVDELAREAGVLAPGRETLKLMPDIARVSRDVGRRAERETSEAAIAASRGKSASERGAEKLYTGEIQGSSRDWSRGIAGGGEAIFEDQIALPQRRELALERLELATGGRSRIDAVGRTPARVRIALPARIGEIALEPLDRRLAVVDRLAELVHVLGVILGALLGFGPLADQSARLLVQSALAVDVLVPARSAVVTQPRRTMPA